MDIKDLKLLIKMITETDITEFELDNSEEKIVIRRGPKTEYINVAAPAPQMYCCSSADGCSGCCSTWCSCCSGGCC